jgi:hypothetical protein
MGVGGTRRKAKGKEREEFCKKKCRTKKGRQRRRSAEKGKREK